MNRREFLMVAGAGALSLAGKKPPPRPSFTVEIEVLTNKIWVNGKSPEKAWTSPNDGVYNLDFDAKGLVIGGVTFDSIKAKGNSCDNDYQAVGAEVVMVNSKGTFHGRITKTVDARLEYAKEKNVKIKLLNGEMLELLDDQRYFRIDF